MPAATAPPTAAPTVACNHARVCRCCLQVLEETGLELGSAEYAYAVNSVFPSGAHYVTVFCRAAAPPGAQPLNLEPLKCEGWEWVEYDRLVADCQPMFLPLAKLLESPWRPQ